jgi:hypothetical protein
MAPLSCRSNAASFSHRQSSVNIEVFCVKRTQASPFFLEEYMDTATAAGVRAGIGNVQYLILWISLPYTFLTYYEMVI